MPKELQKRCLQCVHAMRDPVAPADQVIAGTVQHLCLEGPPTTVGLITQRGFALITTYPNVNADTISCDRFAGFACETSGDLK